MQAFRSPSLSNCEHADPFACVRESTSSFRTWIAIEEIFQSRNSFI